MEESVARLSWFLWPEWVRRAADSGSSGLRSGAGPWAPGLRGCLPPGRGVTEGRVLSQRVSRGEAVVQSAVAVSRTGRPVAGTSFVPHRTAAEPGRAAPPWDPTAPTHHKIQTPKGMGNSLLSPCAEQAAGCG